MRRAQSLAMPLAVAMAAAFISIGQAADAQAATGGTARRQLRHVALF